MKTLLTLTFFTLLLNACASTAPKGNPEASAATFSKDMAIEITYLRGMNSHRFVVDDEKESARIRCYRDHRLLKEIKIDRSKFSDLVSETHTVVASLERHPAAKNNAPCRTPFTVRVRDDHEIKSIAGCRATDEGAVLGKLLKDVEYIMSSP